MGQFLVMENVCKTFKKGEKQETILSHISLHIEKSAFSRRLRESYFYVNLTPTVRHLNK